MIPQFPEFKSLELSDKKSIELFTKRFPPYSDFNFVSMWAWDVRGEMSASWLNENLVIKFSHYLTEDSFLSFIGENKISETIKALIKVSKNEMKLLDELKLIPGFIVDKLDKKEFSITEEPEQFDYLYDMKVIAEFSGSKFADKRTAINKLIKRCPTLRVGILDLNEERTKFDIKKVNLTWLKLKVQKDPYYEVQNELIAIDRFLNSSLFEKMITIGVFIDDSIVAYHVVEKVRDNQAICHYIKADFSHTGIYEYLMRETAKMLVSQGIDFLNFEQDLGLQGLRASKERFSTGLFLKKYKIVVK